VVESNSFFIKRGEIADLLILKKILLIV